MTWGLTCPLTIFDIQVVQTFLQNFNSLKILKSRVALAWEVLWTLRGPRCAWNPWDKRNGPAWPISDRKGLRWLRRWDWNRCEICEIWWHVVTCGDMWWHARTLLSMRTTHVVQPFLSKIWAHRQLMSVDPSLQIWFKANAQKVCFIAHHFSTFSILFLGLCLQNTMKLRFQSFLRNSEWRNWVPARMSWNLSSKREMQRCQTETKDAKV